jgi:hypothetical protein
MPLANRENMPNPTDRIAELLSAGVSDKVYPGAVWAFGDTDGTRATGATGPGESPQASAVFDAAGLTRILAVWSSTGVLREAGKLDLEPPLGGFWPEVEGRPLGAVGGPSDQPALPHRRAAADGGHPQHLPRTGLRLKQPTARCE